MMRMPSDVVYDVVLDAIAPLALPDFEARLRERIGDSDDNAAAVTCAFAPADVGGTVADDIRQYLARACFSTSYMLRFFASRAIRRLNDPVLDRGIVERLLLDGPIAGSDPHDRHAQGPIMDLVATILERRPAIGSDTLFDMLPVYTLGWLSEANVPGARKAFRAAIDRAVQRLLAPIPASAPAGLTISVTVEDDGRNVTHAVSAARDDDHSVSLGSPDAPPPTMDDVMATEVARRAALAHEAQAYVRALDDEDASFLLAAPNLGALGQLVHDSPKDAAAWLAAILATEDRARLRQCANLAIALASAYASHDAMFAGKVFDHASQVTGAAYVSFRSERVPLYATAVFHAADVGRFHELRDALFAQAFTDEAIEELVAAAEWAGARAWLDDHIDRCTASPTPAEQARGITAAGFRHRNEHSDAVLSRDWGTGFLGDVAVSAITAYRHAKWTEHWLRLAAAGQTPEDFWRFSVLAEGVADRRVFDALRALYRGPDERGWLTAFRDSLWERLGDAQKERTKTRAKTLFGQRAPSHDLLAVLNESADS